MFARLALAAAFLAILAGCEGKIGEPSAKAPPGWNGARDGSTAIDSDGGTGGPGPVACEPQPSAIPKLLRLSNHEYRNMVSDLIGAPIDEALFERWTPVAEVYGFDTMSETRVDQQALEEQLATAEALAELMLSIPSLTAHCPAIPPEEAPACTPNVVYSSRDDFSDVQARECWTYLDTGGTPMIFDNARGLWRKEPDETALLWREGAHPGSTVDVVRRWQSPLTGTATISVDFADADPGGGDGVFVSVVVNDQSIFDRDLANGAQTSFTERRGFARGDRVDFVIRKKAGAEYDTTAFNATLQFTPTPRKAAWTWRSCAESIATNLAGRAFRRPLRPAELDDYRTMFQSVRREAETAGFSEPVDEALKALLAAILLSPNFVFKPELVPNGVDEAERSYAIASRLSLFFRSSIPDDELWALAIADGLRDESAIRAQALRLVRRDLERFATHFGGQWLAYRELNRDNPLAEQMRRESRDVFAAVLSEGSPPASLMRPGFTIVDPELAAFYGLPAGDSRVITNDRGGLLSQAAFLSRTGNGSEFRRPIHRGLWVLTRLLCQSLPRLDMATREEIGMSLGTIDPNLPLPEKMALHRNSQTRCGACHTRIDPIGIALEKYDAQGLWRETYPDGAPIVTNLELNGVVVRDPHELSAAIASSSDFESCVSTKLLTFALNRGPLEAELCLPERLAKSSDGTPRSLEDLAIEALMTGLELTEVSP